MQPFLLASYSISTGDDADRGLAGDRLDQFAVGRAVEHVEEAAAFDDGGDYARQTIRRMFELCRKGVAFNMLNARHPEMKSLTDLVAFDPDAMLAFCSQITPDSRYRTDYLDNDFTIYMRRI